MNNKTRMQMGAAVLALVIWGMATIVTCCVVWNSKPGNFFAVAAVINLLATAGAIYIIGKKVSKHFDN